jgi:perosamine synthetase
MTGSFGEMACFSFYANKVITTGEGGMVVTDDDALADRLRLLRNLGFRKPRFQHDVAAFNFRMTGLQAAMGVTQTRKIEAVIREKRRVAHAYNRLLGDLDWLQLPPELDWARNVYWMYAVVVREGARVSRDLLAQRLDADGVETRTFFCPMSDQPCVTRLAGYRPVATPVADRLWRAGLYLPSSPTLTEAQLVTVAESVKRAGAAG